MANLPHLRGLIPRAFPTFRHAYRQLAEAVLTAGTEVAPRGEPTLELEGASFCVLDPRDTLATGVNRRFNVRFAAADALQVLGGFADHAWAAQYNPRIAHYGEHGAYGPRLAPQMPGVLERLRLDSSSRRAVALLWDRDRDLDYREDATDYPCTTEVQFLIRGGLVDLHVTMRSNDLWWGTPFDVFTFSQLQLTVATLLGREVGTYYHRTTSLHLYEKDWEAAAALTDPETAEPTYTPGGLGWRGETWADVLAVAAVLKANGHPDPGQPLGRVLTPAEEWYAARLAPRPK